MLSHARRRIFLLASLLCAAAASGQQPGPSTATTAPATTATSATAAPTATTAPGAGRIVLDVVVTAKSGAPVGGLQQQDFTLLDNKVPQTLASFQAVAGREASLDVTVVIDSANAVYRTQAHATLYSIDPLGTSDIGAAIFYWREFVKGVSKPSEIQAANLALPVLATQSGGIAFNSNNDVSAELQKCFVDIGTYYELSFDPSPAGGPRQYHQLEVRVAKPGLTARTRQGYYSQP